MTHFIDGKGQTISFHSLQPVRAFTAGTPPPDAFSCFLIMLIDPAGMYSLKPDQKTACLVYVTIEVCPFSSSELKAKMSLNSY